MTRTASSLYPLHDTIAAIATPSGQGGVGIIRISGSAALTILHTLMTPPNGSPPSFLPRFMRYGWIRDAAGDKLDEVLAVYMPSPASFTGEDVAEIHCHGGMGVLAAILEEICRAGARSAGRGEFTYRAFVNGKYDLPRAEAIAEMIAAPSRQGVRLAQAKLSGMLGVKIAELRSGVEDLRARVALAVDFPEEEAEVLGIDDFSADLAGIENGIATLLAAYERARLWREGALVLLAGRVNMGKSSLLNALLGRTRAIVSATPGTTRDFIEEYLDLNGLHVRLVDTAGLRHSDDPVEMEGVAKALELAGEASLVVLVTDAAAPLTAEERAFIAQNSDRIFIVRNKLDTLPFATQREALSTAFHEGYPASAVSATTGLGLDACATSLRRAILARENSEEPETGDATPNARQRELLACALAEAKHLAQDIASHMACDLFSVRLDSMAAALDEITGFATTDDILGSIFSRFCIGK